MKQLILILFLVFTISCSNKRPEPNFYKNLYTGEILNKTEFVKFSNSLHLENKSSTEKTHITFKFYKLEKSSDSIIQQFKYDLRVGSKYIVRSDKYEKIGTKIPQQNLTSINGEEVIIGGKQDKPTLINLWFIECPGCVAEIPALNRLKEKYSDKVNFIALNPDSEEDVRKFLKKKKFEFIHIANVRNFIKEIGSYPYPENIFIDKEGYIRNIEGPLPSDKDANLNLSIEYFEEIIKELL